MASSFNKILQSITAVKLQELDQSDAFQSHARVLAEAKATPDPVAKVELLRKAAVSCGPMSNTAVKCVLDLDNLESWLRQAQQDPAFEKANLERWADTLETHIRQANMRFDCGRLFGDLFKEWIASGDSALGTTASEHGNASIWYVNVGRKEKQEQLDRFKSFMFDEKSVDTKALLSYLNNVFSDKDARKKLEKIRGDIKNFCDETMDYTTIKKYEVVEVIDAFLSGQGSISDDNLMALTELRQNDTLLTELADVLTMRLASIGTWSWPAEGVPVQMRRHLNGKYTAFTDPDVVDALLLHYIGLSWQGESFFWFSRAWGSRLPKMSEEEKRRLRSQLSNYSGIASLRSRFCAKSPVETKQKLLRLLATECQLNTKLYNKHAVIRSNFEWFGPSLSHASILTVLEFFGVTTEWLDFFKKWLAEPLRFVDSDNSDGVRLRKRGTPFNHTLSTFCAEAVLYVMDFAVNQAGDGLKLCRLRDDLCLFDPDATKCARGWKEMNTYANLVGLTFNKEKTGSACVGYDEQTIADLPSGHVRWGMLKFDSTQGRFTIDQAQVDAHIEELRRQLNATKSIVGWINAYNKYMAFFYRNFGGHPARCFGKDHLDDLLKTFARIQFELFKDTGNKSAVGYLQERIAKKFGISDLPEAYFYFPTTSGGLELKNPFIELCSIDRQKFKDIFEVTLKEDKESYESRKREWNEDNYCTEFMTFEVFLFLRDSCVPAWGDRYAEALTDHDVQKINMTPAIDAALRSSKHWTDPWDKLNGQDQWLLALYGEQLMDKFGALDPVDPDLIPKGMVELFKRLRIQLDE